MLGRRLPPAWEVLLLDLPGRGKLADRRLLHDPHDLVRRVVADLAEVRDDDVLLALFGHSMGAMLLMRRNEGPSLRSERVAADPHLFLPRDFPGDPQQGPHIRFSIFEDDADSERSNTDANGATSALNSASNRAISTDASSASVVTSARSASARSAISDPVRGLPHTARSAAGGPGRTPCQARSSVARPLLRTDSRPQAIEPCAITRSETIEK